MMYDLTEFLEEEKQIKVLEVGKCYEFTHKNHVCIYFIKEKDHLGYLAVSENNFSTLSDFGGRITDKSSRKTCIESDMYAMEHKKIRELTKRETKEFVSKHLKSWSIRNSFGLSPIKALNRHGDKVEVKQN